ncbi:MAG: hypothetical protein HY000_19880 [Planctomycetes bacterium]|nr:hypothetical protein [Planctomycetota bacterium]
MSAWCIERLSKKHDRSSFDCGHPALNKWLREQAGQSAKKDLARTYVATLSDEALAEQIGIHAFEIDAIDDSARDFYFRFGFESLADDPRHLLLPIRTIRKLNLPPLHGNP